jgi:hypothetical protein
MENLFAYGTLMCYEIFQQDRKTRDAVVRNLEIIGEAAGRTRGGTTRPTEATPSCTKERWTAEKGNSQVSSQPAGHCRRIHLT